MSKVSQKQLETGNKTTAITKKYTIKETRSLIKEIVRANCDPELILKELGENILPKLINGNEKEQKEAKKLLEEKSTKALMALGLKTNIPLAEVVDEKYRPLVMEFTHQLIREHNCQTSDEKALAQVIVNAYARILEHSQILNTCRKIDWLTNEKINYYSMISKELDRANRQFITALTTLKQIKTSFFEISVKAKTAFVAQNQQLNINPNKNENVEPK